MPKFDMTIDVPDDMPIGTASMRVADALESLSRHYKEKGILTPEAKTGIRNDGVRIYIKGEKEVALS